MGARSVVTSQRTANLVKPGPKRQSQKLWKRRGPLSEAESNLVTQWALDQPHEVSEQQTKALARAMGRPLPAVQSAVEQARDTFRERAGRYADLHMAAVEGAMATGDARGFDAAIKGAQWAMEKVSGPSGERMIEPAKAAAADSGTRILVGIQVGGVDNPNQVISLPAERQISAVSAVVTPDQE